MTETTYEVRISVWNLDADNKDHEMTEDIERTARLMRAYCIDRVGGLE